MFFLSFKISYIPTWVTMIEFHRTTTIPQNKAGKHTKIANPNININWRPMSGWAETSHCHRIRANDIPHQLSPHTTSVYIHAFCVRCRWIYPKDAIVYHRFQRNSDNLGVCQVKAIMGSRHPKSGRKHYPIISDSSKFEPRSVPVTTHRHLQANHAMPMNLQDSWKIGKLDNGERVPSRVLWGTYWYPMLYTAITSTKLNAFNATEKLNVSYTRKKKLKAGNESI